MNDKKQGSDVPGELPTEGFIPLDDNMGGDLRLTNQARVAEAPYSHQSMRWGWHPNIPKGNKTG